MLALSGRHAQLTIERTSGGDWRGPMLETVFSRSLT